MSSNYNILMHQFNGTDFDNLYPQTLDSQIQTSTLVQTATGATNGENAFLFNAPWKLIQTYTSADSGTFTTPSNVSQLGVFVIGGGQKGSSSTETTGSFTLKGGASGFSNFGVIDSPISSYSYVVGAGGGKVSGDSGLGHSSSFGGIVANGGGTASDGVLQPNYYNGGQMPTYGSEYRYSNGKCPAYGLINYFSLQTSNTNPKLLQSPVFCINPFDGNPCLIAGGSMNVQNGSIRWTEEAITDFYGNTSSGSGSSVTSGTSYGCGGGACFGSSGANGADGAILIYAKFQN